MTPDDVAVTRQKEGMRPRPVVPRTIAAGLVVVAGAALATTGWLVGLFGLVYGFVPAIAIGVAAVAGATILLAVKTERLGWVLFAMFGAPMLVLLVLSRL